MPGSHMVCQGHTWYARVTHVIPGSHMLCHSHTYYAKVKMVEVKSSMAMAGASQWRIYYHRMWVNYQLLAVITEVAQCWTPSCSRSKPPSDNSVRDGRSIDWSNSPPSWAVPPELHVLHGVNAAYKSQDLLKQPWLEHPSTGMTDQRTAPHRV